MSQIAGTESMVNGPYMSDTHSLWAEIEAMSPPVARKKRPESTPRSRKIADKQSELGHLRGDTAPPPPAAPREERATGEQASRTPTPDKEKKAAGSHSAASLKDVLAAGDTRRPTASTPGAPMYGKPDALSVEELAAKRRAEVKAAKEKKAAKAAAAKPSSHRSASPKGSRAPSSPASSDGRGKKAKSKAKSARARSPSPGRQRPMIQPRWDATGPPKRFSGEVVNKYNTRADLETSSAEMWSVGGSGGHEESNVTVNSMAASMINRVTTSPSTRCHPNPDRRAELRGSDMFSNINYFATSRVANKTSGVGDAVYSAPDNDRKMKEASWVSSQAWFESLRYYPKGEEAVINDDCEMTFSGNTHGATVPSEHLENDVRNRVGIAAADPAWMPSQLQEPWAPELDARLRSLKVSKPARSSPTK